MPPARSARPPRTLRPRLRAGAAMAADPSDRHATRAIPREAPDYPARVRELRDAPRVLYVRGELPQGPAVAIVGSRAASNYGRARAGELARDLARLGCVIVSGLARGIDAT